MIHTYFAFILRVQVQRWQQQQQEQGRSKQAAKPEASLTLCSIEEEPAAMAVLAALYGVSTPPGQLSDLQQLHMVLLADMLQVPAVATDAVNHLTIVSGQQPGLSDAAVQYLRGLQAWPSYLLDEFPDLTRHIALQDVAAMWASAAAPSSPADVDALLKVCVKKGKGCSRCCMHAVYCLAKEGSSLLQQTANTLPPCRPLTAATCS